MKNRLARLLPCIALFLAFAPDAGAALREAHLTISEHPLTIAGRTTRALTVNGGVPGPTLTWTVGDRIERRNVDSDLGGTMRLGAYPCQVADGSRVHGIYGEREISERHRHRYEFNNTYMDPLQEAGLSIAGKTLDGSLVEVVELPNHPWFVGCQFHPEFTSTPRDGHPLFRGFVEAANDFHESLADEPALAGE